MADHDTSVILRESIRRTQDCYLDIPVQHEDNKETVASRRIMAMPCFYLAMEWVVLECWSVSGQGTWYLAATSSGG